MGYEIRLKSKSPGACLEMTDPPMTVTRKWKTVAQLTPQIKARGKYLETRDIREKKAEVIAKATAPEKAKAAPQIQEIEVEIFKVPRRTYEEIATQYGITRAAVSSIARDLRAKRKK